jgi:hypothetical protein
MFSSTMKLMEAVLQVEATRKPQRACHVFSNKERAVKKE